MSLDISAFENERLKINYYEDLQRNIDPEQLKEFIQNEMRQNRLTYRDLEKLV